MQKSFFSLKSEEQFEAYEDSEIDKFLRRLEDEIKETQLSQINKDLDNLTIYNPPISSLDPFRKIIQVDLTQQQQQTENRLLLQYQRQQQQQQEQSDHLSIQYYESRILEDILAEKFNSLDMKRQELIEENRSLAYEIERCELYLSRISQLTSINDAFHIWFLGPYGTINNFRVGSLPARPTDFNEINAGLGQAALVVDTIAQVIRIEFKSFTISPMGSYAKMVRVEDKRSYYPLYIEQSSLLSLFPKKYFNLAFAGFMSCIAELGEFVAVYDPTMTMPYRISISEAKIGEISYVYGVDDEVWTKALKYTLTNIKWIIAWYTKHGNHFVTYSN